MAHSRDGVVDKDFIRSENECHSALVSPGTPSHNLLGQVHLFVGAQSGGGYCSAANVLCGRGDCNDACALQIRASYVL